MAVESFLQPPESKQTVEKPVKQKPSITELTTIEFPGKPVPANYLESSPPKKVYKRKKVSKSPLIKISAAFTKNYLEVLQKLARKAEEIIIATDYDIEGEVIGWNVLRFICGRETAKRMKYSTLTKNELVQAYENPMPQPDWGQAYAGETRHILDWLYGINLSRALMSAIKTAGSFKILSIGRVQGPALKI